MQSKEQNKGQKDRVFKVSLSKFHLREEHWPSNSFESSGFEDLFSAKSEEEAAKQAWEKWGERVLLLRASHCHRITLHVSETDAHSTGHRSCRSARHRKAIVVWEGE